MFSVCIISSISSANEITNPRAAFFEPRPNPNVRGVDLIVPDDDVDEDPEGFILCLDIDEAQLDPRDRGRIEIDRRYVLVVIMDDGEVWFEVQDYKYNCLQCTFYPRAVASYVTDFVLPCFLSGTLQVYSWFQK